MALFAIGDLHLSLGTDKPMDLFSGWSDYVQRIEKNWKRLVAPEDTVVVAGDISWAMKLEECYTDFHFLNNLPGKKILLKGNHDYWWSTKSKMERYLAENKFNTISILFNNSFEVPPYAVCGTRGWTLDSSSQEDIKIISREAGRLKTSLEQAKGCGLEPLVFLHYPPVYGISECTEILNLLFEYDVKQCFYGHLHGSTARRLAVTGEYKSINFSLIACDNTGFCPVLIR